MKKILLLPILLTATACDNGELSEVRKEVKGTSCAIQLPATCEKFIAQAEKEKQQRVSLITNDDKISEWSDTSKYIAKLKKQYGDKLCDSQEYADIIEQYGKIVAGYNQLESFGIPLKNRNSNCIEPLSKAAELCNYDEKFADWEAVVLDAKNIYASYLNLCPDRDTIKNKQADLKKDLSKEKQTKCKNISYCKKDLAKGCITTLPLDKSCLMNGKVVFTDEKHGGIFVQPRQDSVSTMFNNGFINAFGLGENVACRDVYFIKTNKQFFSEDRVSLSGYWRYIGPYKYLESNAERTTKAFERANISAEIYALCGGQTFQTSSNNELESFIRFFSPETK